MYNLLRGGHAAVKVFPHKGTRVILKNVQTVWTSWADAVETCTSQQEVVCWTCRLTAGSVKEGGPGRAQTEAGLMLNVHFWKCCIKPEIKQFLTFFLFIISLIFDAHYLQCGKHHNYKVVERKDHKVETFLIMHLFDRQADSIGVWLLNLCSKTLEKRLLDIFFVICSYSQNLFE